MTFVFPIDLARMRNLTPLHQRPTTYDPEQFKHLFAVTDEQFNAMNLVLAQMWEEVIALRTEHPDAAGMLAPHDGGVHVLRGDEIASCKGIGIKTFSRLVLAFQLRTLGYALSRTLLRLDLAGAAEILQARVDEKVEDRPLFDYMMGEFSPGIYMLASFVRAAIANQADPTLEATIAILQNSQSHVDQWASQSAGGFGTARLATILPELTGDEDEETLHVAVDYMLSSPTAFCLRDGALDTEASIELDGESIERTILGQSPTRAQCPALFITTSRGIPLLADSVLWTVEAVRVLWPALNTKRAD